jgi:hypothetical protein
VHSPQAGTAWADRTRRALVKRNSGQPLGRGLAAAASALDRARAQLSRLQVLSFLWLSLTPSGLECTVLHLVRLQVQLLVLLLLRQLPRSGSQAPVGYSPKKFTMCPQ